MGSDSNIISLIGWEGVTNISKTGYIVLAILCIFFQSAQLFSQDIPNSQNEHLNENPSIQVPQNALNDSAVDETTLLIAGGNTDTAVSETAQESTVWLFIRMILVLLIVIGAIYGAVAFFRRGMNPQQTQDEYLRTVAQVSLGTGKSARVITVGNQAFLIGVSESAVSLISEITDKELIDAMNINAEKLPSVGPRDFSTLLSKFFPMKSEIVQEKDVTAYFSAAEETQEYLRKRRTEIQTGTLQNREEGYETPMQ